MATCSACNNFYMGSECPFCRVEKMKKVDPEELRLEEEKKKEALRLKEERVAQSGRIIVTTADLKEEYDVLGPVYFQVSNKGIFSSTLEKLMKQYQTKINEQLDDGLMARDSVGIGNLLFMPLFDLAMRESSFETAFYIATEELKKRAAIIGADAIVGMRQDIDIDTNGFQFFYLQMYGTAVKLRKPVKVSYSQQTMESKTSSSQTEMDSPTVGLRSRRRNDRISEV